MVYLLLLGGCYGILRLLGCCYGIFGGCYGISVIARWLLCYHMPTRVLLGGCYGISCGC